MKRVLIAALAAVLTVSAFTGAAVLTGRFKNSVVPVAHAIPMSATISLPSASAKLESAQGPALTSGAALCAAVTPATPDAVEAAIATTERKAAEEQAKAEAEAKAKAEAAAKAKAAQLTALKTSGKTLGSGVINAADVRLRSESSTSSSILATLSKGTAVTVLAQSDGWYAVSCNNTTGYVAQQYVTMGDSLPADTTTDDAAADDNSANDSTADDSSSVPSSGSGSSAVSIAYQYLGVPYVYGGASPSGFDCSGFTMYIYKQFGYSLPHSATSQWLSGMGTKIYSISELQPGDLVFFNDPSRNKGKACSHAGIYIGNGQHVHASSSRNGGVITSDLTSGYYNTYFVGGLRLS